MSQIGARAEKKPDDQKSRPFRFRLHPQSEDQAEVGLHHELNSRMNGRGNIRQYLIDLYRKAEKIPEKEKPIPVIDTRKIMKKLEAILARLQGISMGTSAPQIQEPVDYDDDFLASLDRMLDAGMSNDDLKYYDEDE